MKRITIVGALAAFVILAALAVATKTSERTVPTVYASQTVPGCTVATLNGNYAVMQPGGFTVSGNSTTGNEVPWQFVGVANFDGQGNIQVIYSAVVNGAFYSNQTGTGSYDLRSGPNFSECIGTINLPLGSDPGYAANIAVVGGGAEVFGISTNAGGTAAFDAKKQ